MKKKKYARSTTIGRITKPDKNRVKTDPFDRVLNLARKKYEKAEVELAKARTKIEELEQDLPGLRDVIAGLESYLGQESTFPDHALSQPREFTHTIIDRPEIVSAKDPAPHLISGQVPPVKRGPKPKAGQPSLYTCNKCGGFTAIIGDSPLVCSNDKCLSTDLVAKEVKGPTRQQPGGAGVSAIQTMTQLPSNEGDDHLLNDGITGNMAKQ